MTRLCLWVTVCLALCLAANAAAQNCPSPLPADLNQDCVVGWDDWMLMASEWLTPAGSQANIAGDEAVSLADFALLASQWAPISPLPRVAVIKNDPAPRFVRNGAEFRLVGCNQVKVVDEWHAYLDIVEYDPAQTEADLTHMEQSGYNVFRMFLNHIDLGAPVTTTDRFLNEDYLANLKDFLIRANRHNIYVILVTSFVPYNSYYYGYGGGPDLTQFGSGNAFILSPQLINSKRVFLMMLVDAVKSWCNGNLLSTVLSYELENEIHGMADYPPFSWTSGTVTCADGVTYDMGDAASRQQCLDAGVNYWFDQLRFMVKQRDPQALVTFSVFTFHAVGKAGPLGLVQGYPDERWPARPLTVMMYTDIDYMDVHLYELHGPMATQLASSEYGSWPTDRVPWIMGEFGAYKGDYASASAAAQPMLDWRTQAKYQFGCKGGLFWVYDCDWVRQDFWNLLDENHVLNWYLAPGGLGSDY